MAEHCPTCYARRAADELQEHMERGIGASVRAGMARGHLELLALSKYGWRFCASHAAVTKLESKPTVEQRHREAAARLFPLHSVHAPKVDQWIAGQPLPDWARELSRTW